MTKKIIITADDFGMCNEVNEAIIHGMEFGLISSTNVMVNMSAAEAAKSLRERFPDASVGIHWNVTTGKPVCRPDQIKSLVDSEGNFFSINEFKKRYYGRKIRKGDLMRELDAQYQIFRELCGNADYWNTHENSALCVPAFYAFSEIALKYGIPASRNFQRLYIDYDIISNRRKMREIAVRNFVNLWFGIIIKRKFKLPDARLFSFKLTSKYDLALLIRTLSTAKQKSVEIVVHPATSGSNPLFGNIGKERYSEYRFVTDGILLALLRDYGLQICNFKKAISNG